MLGIYKTELNDPIFKKLDDIEKGSWINIDKPTESEIQYVIDKTGVLPEYIRSALDEEEKARVEIEENELLIILDMPYIFNDDDIDKMSTIPMGIIILEDYIITVCSVQNDIIDKMINLNRRSIYTYKKSRLAIQMLLNIAKEYLRKLRIIEKQIDRLKDDAKKNAGNKEVFKLLELQNSLVYFSTSLKGNEIVMERLMKITGFKKYEEDEDILEDAIIENRQAIEMANIYSQITSSLVEAFGSIISNNLNEVMKFLASLTIIISIPNIIYGFYGMNVNLPFQENANAIIIVLVFSLALTYMSYLILKKFKMI